MEFQSEALYEYRKIKKSLIHRVDNLKDSKNFNSPFETNNFKNTTCVALHLRVHIRTCICTIVSF